MGRVFSAVIAILSLVSVVIFATGYIVNPKYEGEMVMIVNYPKDEVFSVLTNIDAIPRRKKDVVSVEKIATYRNLIAWREEMSFNRFRKYRMIERKENERLKIEMTESSFDMNGTLEFILSDSGDSTQVKIIESSSLKSTFTRGYRFYLSRNFESQSWSNMISAGLFDNLLHTP